MKRLNCDIKDQDDNKLHSAKRARFAEPGAVVCKQFKALVEQHCIDRVIKGYTNCFIPCERSPVLERWLTDELVDFFFFTGVGYTLSW
jgi:hypothetical protein